MSQQTELVENWWDEGLHPITGFVAFRGFRKYNKPKKEKLSSFSKHYEYQEKNL